jgi:cobalt-precorrin-5B (C1)-methyltransferase
MLREQQVVDEVDLNLPTGETARFRLHGQRLSDDGASCYVIKDAGDDPDVTNGAEVHVLLQAEFFTPNRVVVRGGTGIGRVTKPGLAVAVGEWAINPVPRRMIAEAVKEVFAMRCMPVTLTVTVSIPDGEARAKKTLNERLGIVGGLSILGTTGIVRPISAEAWTATIDTAIDVALACGCESVVLSTGRTSELAAQKHFGTRNSKLETRKGLKEEAFVMMGDHVGYTLRACARKGVGLIVVAGQFAKLIKIAAGHEQTHASSSELDLRTLEQWVAGSPHASRLTPHVRGAHTARQALADSGNDPLLVELVCGKVREFAAKLAPRADIKVFLAGYQGEVLYCR